MRAGGRDFNPLAPRGGDEEWRDSSLYFVTPDWGSS